MWQYKYSDELYHWKYIKREKVNGKWKYYYDADQLKSDVGITAYNATRNSEKMVNDANTRRQVGKWNYENQKEEYGSNPDEYGQEKIKEAKADYDSAANKHAALLKNHEKVVKSYYKTPIGKIEKFARSGLDAVDRLFKRKR